MVDGAAALGVVLGIVEVPEFDFMVPELEVPELDVPELVLGLVEPEVPEVRSLQATVPATVKQAMAIKAAIRSVCILCSFSKLAARPTGRGAYGAATAVPGVVHGSGIDQARSPVDLTQGRSTGKAATLVAAQGGNDMKSLKTIGLAALACCALAACGGNGSAGADVDESGARGSLIQSPPLRVTSLTAAEVTKQLQDDPLGQQLLQVSGPPTCGIDLHYIQYGTVGGKGEQTTASGALMIPTGSAASCTGPRPVLLHAHGIAFERSYNLAALTDTTNPARSEGLLIAAIFAAQGYIVVAPNYAGYDSSPLPYHPFVNADQQSKEMIDALTAARKAIGHVFASGTTDNGKLFVSGYSQGGYVAMATVRALQQANQTVTASSPMSGPYALEAFVDAAVFGLVPIGATLFMPFLTTSYQQTYGNLYNATTDIYSTTYATGIDTLVPSRVPYTELFTQGKLPQSALFSSTTPVTGNGALDAALAVPANPLFAMGFGDPFLVLNSVRVAYAMDALASPDGAFPAPQPGVPVASTVQYPLRAAVRLNDMRNTAWAPTRPMLLCGGNADPTIFYSVNTGTMQAFWSGLPAGLVTGLDVDSAPTGPGDPFAAAKVGFATAKANAFAAGGQTAVVTSYHGTLVPPFCMAAARGFFSQF